MVNWSVQWINISLCLSPSLECKLSRSGPPATIEAIDEESPNGKVHKNVVFFVAKSTSLKALHKAPT